VIARSTPVQIVIWQNMLSHLQSAHVRALAECPGVDVAIVGLGTISADRTALGWSVPNFGNSRVFDSPSDGRVLEIVESSDAQCVHMLAGWRGLPRARFVLDALKRRSARIGLLTEGTDVRGWKGLARCGAYILDRLRFAGPFDFILAMGTQGSAWFSQCGYPQATIFPYAYITEKPPLETYVSPSASQYELLFLGQLVHRKGVDLLLRALSGLKHSSWRLTLVGDGSEKSALVSLAASLGIADRTAFLPAMRYASALSYLACADMLVLPSRYDGWGAVVNEALMAGVPVVCSDRSGARDLVGMEQRGEVFPAGSVPALRAALKRRISTGKRSAELARSIREWSKCIEGPRGAEYILDVIAHVYEGGARPLPIWSGGHAK
jgi:glycosyltransferase involved in cell wall biosynthesis